ncbi:unnamed protein product [Mytilus coruscus]|uniref:Uncharacterized protein n=1 Tax=Mytilus coruscus TaxID=42192 RepID=A0A6J8DEU8_MYTCO|nr:unnamed protein product [Mytilus coruscus]
MYLINTPNVGQTVNAGEFLEEHDYVPVRQDQVAIHYFMQRKIKSKICKQMRLKLPGILLLRWAMALQHYTFDIKHIGGKDNTCADALSRRTYPETHPDQDQMEDGPKSADIFTLDKYKENNRIYEILLLISDAACCYLGLFRVRLWCGEKLNTVNLKESVKKSNFNGRVSIQNDKLKIKNNLLRTFFDYAIENILAELKKLVQKEELRDVKTLLVVGGHSESPVLINALNENFSNLDIVVPKHPSLAILKGAVLYGFESETITCRVMQYTYGIAMQRPFIPGVDPESKKKNLVNGLVDNVFDKHTERGQTVNAGEFLKEHDYVPVRQDQVAVHYEFYATENKNPKYVTDEGCSCIGILYFELSGGMKSNKAMKLKINPSGTQIIAVVTEKDTGKESEGYFCLLD